MKEILKVQKITIIKTLLWLCLLVVVLLPLLPVFLYSFSQSWRFPHIFPEDLGLQGWKYILQSSNQIVSATVNSIISTGATLVLSLLLGIPAGRVLGLFKFRYKSFIEFFVYIPFLVSPIALIVGVHALFVYLSLTDTMFGVILVHIMVALPYAILCMSAVFANYNTTYEEVARTLNCPQKYLFPRVIFPLIVPGVICTSVFVVLVSWNQYILSLVVGGGRVITLPVLLLNYVSAGDFILSGVVGVVFLFPMILLFVGSSKVLSEQVIIIR